MLLSLSESMFIRNGKLALQVKKKCVCYAALHTSAHVWHYECVSVCVCVRLDGHGRQLELHCSSSLAVINRHVSFPMVPFAWLETELTLEGTEGPGCYTPPHVGMTCVHSAFLISECICLPYHRLCEHVGIHMFLLQTDHCDRFWFTHVS